MFVKPRLGKRRCSGICPPSDHTLGLPPERAFNPLWPREAVFPCPDPGPRPTRLRALREPTGGCSVLSVAMVSPSGIAQCPPLSLNAYQMPDLVDHPAYLRRIGQGHGF